LLPAGGDPSDSGAQGPVFAHIYAPAAGHDSAAGLTQEPNAFAGFLGEFVQSNSLPSHEVAEAFEQPFAGFSRPCLSARRHYLITILASS
jgi:hypothetical protein